MCGAGGRGGGGVIASVSLITSIRVKWSHFPPALFDPVPHRCVAGECTPRVSCPVGLVVKASASRTPDLGSIPAFAVGFFVCLFWVFLLLLLLLLGFFFFWSD